MSPLTLAAALTVGALAPLLTQCDPPAVVTCNEEPRQPCNVAPPQRLDLVMNGLPGDTNSIVARCDNYGGTIRIESPHLVCQGVDY